MKFYSSLVLIQLIQLLNVVPSCHGFVPSSSSYAGPAAVAGRIASLRNNKPSFMSAVEEVRVFKKAYKFACYKTFYRGKSWIDALYFIVTLAKWIIHANFMLTFDISSLMFHS